MPASHDRIADAIDTAAQAFWASVAESFPEVTTGDLDPETVDQLEREMGHAILTWLGTNGHEVTDPRATYLWGR